MIPLRAASVTRHVGLGTFQPVTAGDLDDHPMPAESYVVTASTVEAIEHARARGAPVVAIGTTVVRALESSADPPRLGFVPEMAGETRLLIQAGFAFLVVDQLVTSFRLPESTLLGLVSAFAGRERVLGAYRAAVDAGDRFFIVRSRHVAPRARIRRGPRPVSGCTTPGYACQLFARVLPPPSPHEVGGPLQFPPRTRAAHSCRIRERAPRCRRHVALRENPHLL